VYRNGWGCGSGGDCNRGGGRVNDMVFSLLLLLLLLVVGFPSTFTVFLLVGCAMSSCSVDVGFSIQYL